METTFVLGDLVWVSVSQNSWLILVLAGSLAPGVSL